MEVKETYGIPWQKQKDKITIDFKIELHLSASENSGVRLK
jgi:hypothetical protein